MAVLKQAGGSYVKWYKSVTLRLFLAIGGIFCLFCILLTNLLFTRWSDYWVGQRLSEVYRYVNFIAGEITISEMEEETQGFQGVRSEMQTVNRRYSYLRIMLLNEDGMVVQDTSSSRQGRYIINSEVLRALSGETVLEQEDNVQRMAAPITVDSNEDIRGVIYAFVSLDSMGQSMEQGRQQIVLIEFIMALVCLGLFLLVILLNAKPFEKLMYWLKNIKADEREEKKPVFPIQDEFRALEDGHY